MIVTFSMLQNTLCGNYRVGEKLHAVLRAKCVQLIILMEVMALEAVPSGFRGRKELLNRASALVTTCP